MLNTNSGKFEIFKGIDGQFYFRLKAPNNEIIGWSEGYTQKHNAISGVTSVRTHSQIDTNFTTWQSSKDNQWYFNLKSKPNNETILRSEGYASKQNALGGVIAVKKYAPNGLLVDLTLSQAA